MNRRKFILGTLATLGLAGVGGMYFVNRPEFGRVPAGNRLDRIMKSPHYVNGRFQNLSPVSIMTDEHRENRFIATLKFVFGDKTNLSPSKPMISTKTDLHALNRRQDVAVWMGHSTYYLQINGWRILIDPVFSAYASPLSFVNKAFPGSNIYNADDIPSLDVLAITHDHWDHLDYPTIMSLKDKIKTIVCPLGVGEFFEEWGFDADILREEDWFTEVTITDKDKSDDLRVNFLPSQHFSGRFIISNPTQWCGYAFITDDKKIYCSGDGGYGEHFKTIGEKFHGFDFAIMENGQYNMAWHNIHMLPQETAQAAADIGAKYVMPSHNGKFALSRHPWQEPYEELTKASLEKPYRLLTPRIGEAVSLTKDTKQEFVPWWRDMN